MKISKLIAISALTTFGIAGLTGCGEDPQATSNSLKVGMTADFAPFEFHSDNQKDYKGFDVDLINAVAKEMGKTVEIQDLAFDGLIPAIQSKNIDVAISAMTITEERQKHIGFSDPYYKSGLAILVRADDTTINTLDDLKGKTIAARVDTTGLDEAKTVENATVKPFKTPQDCFKELQAGNVDAVINDRPVNDYAIKEGGITGLKDLPQMLTEEEYGIAMAKDNSDLKKQVNDALKKLHENGEYDKIFAKWFGDKAPQPENQSEPAQQ
ncbi:MAG: basic amino acid ABC transporter substrate-binding protein [Selenomonadaceae bacterium]|nr:basic amino acid ABC transporter substrate-binding protein [Selenomonadaceae bacterium]